MSTGWNPTEAEAEKLRLANQHFAERKKQMDSKQKIQPESNNHGSHRPSDEQGYIGLINNGLGGIFGPAG